MKKLSFIVCALFIFTGCSNFKSNLSETITPIDQEITNDERTYDGVAEGRIGDTLQTEWFTFKVNEVNFLEEFAGYVPESGRELVLVNLTLKNIFGIPLPFYSSEFSLIFDEELADPLIIDIDTVAPEKFELKRGEIVTYNFIYEIPKENNGQYSIAYVEVYEDDLIGDYYYVYFEKE